MNCDVTISKEDFKTIHNTLWELDCINDTRVRALVERIRTVLADAYQQDDTAFDRKMQYFETVKKGAGLTSTWSIYEVTDMTEPHPYNCADTVVYTDHWGDGPVEEPITGQTWADLYAAADRCIQQSGDGHHVFIEAFEFVTPTKLRLTTGS